MSEWQLIIIGIPAMIIILLVSFLEHLQLRHTRPIFSTEIGHREGEPYRWKYVKYRQCRKTGRVLEFSWDSQGGSWGCVSPQEAEIILRKEKEGKL